MGSEQTPDTVTDITVIEISNKACWDWLGWQLWPHSKTKTEDFSHIMFFSVRFFLQMLVFKWFFFFCTLSTGNSAKDLLLNSEGQILILNTVEGPQAVHLRMPSNTRAGVILWEAGLWIWSFSLGLCLLFKLCLEPKSTKVFHPDGESCKRSPQSRNPSIYVTKTSSVFMFIITTLKFRWHVSV